MDVSTRLRVLKTLQADTIVGSDIWWYYEYLIDKLEGEINGSN